MRNLNTRIQKREGPGWITLLILLALLAAVATCEAQQTPAKNPVVRERVYSSWSSAQVKHAVEIEKPVIKRDTVPDGSGFVKLHESFIYKGFTIYFDDGYRYEMKITVIAGNSIIMLKPDDEYEIIEKLLTLIK